MLNPFGRDYCLLYRRVNVTKVQILYFNNPGGSYVVKSWTFVPLFQPNFLDIRYDWPTVIIMLFKMCQI